MVDASFIQAITEKYPGKSTVFTGAKFDELNRVHKNFFMRLCERFSTSYYGIKNYALIVKWMYYLKALVLFSTGHFEVLK